jgi:hypothetical protein
MKNRNSERGGILGALLIAGAVVVCLMIVGGIIVARSIHVSTNVRSNGGDDVSIDLPGGHLEVRAHDKSGSAFKDIPTYPGAHSNEHHGGDAVVQWSSNKDGGDKAFSVAASEMITSDSVDTVADWYRNQLPNYTIVKHSHGNVTFEMKNGAYKRIVGVHEEGDGTHIGVASVGEPASN